MAKTKQQKTKPKKSHPHVKKQGKQTDMTLFRGQLDPLGLKIVQVTADGNCFFRSLADQLEGSEEEHGKYRRMVVEYIIKNRQLFEPFIEDDVPFDEYCQNMDNDGTWAGHMELQAASLVTHSNICIHQFMLPRWYIRNFDQRGARMVHLSYHDEEHYNSVRLKEDPCDGPARPILIKADADLSATSHQEKSKPGKSNVGSSKLEIDIASIKIAMSGSGCDDAEKVKEVLLLVGGDCDAAIEFLVAEQVAEDQSAENWPLVPNADPFSGNQGNIDGDNSKQTKEDSIDMPKQDDNSDDGVTQLHDDSNSKADGKHQIIPRNKVCPCGSKKKYKACCGAVKGRSSAKIVVQTVDTRKSKKERKQAKKGPVESLQPSRSDPGLGALCI